MFLFSADSGARPVPSELVLWCVVAFTKERSAWSSRNRMLNQSDWIISNCTSSLLLRELLLVPIGCSTLARLAAVHPSSAQPPPSPSLGPRSSATRSRKGLVSQIFTIFSQISDNFYWFYKISWNSDKNRHENRRILANFWEICKIWKKWQHF